MAGTRAAVALAAAALAAGAAWPTCALGAGRSARGFSATDFATGFPSRPACCGASGTVGPTGIAADRGGNLFAIDNGGLYRFTPSGGSASSARLNLVTAISGDPAGLSFSKDFSHLYVARQTTGDVVELDRATGAVTRTLATNIAGATGLATDPISGDLFVSAPFFGSHVLRISGFGAGMGKVSVYAAPGPTDGLAFGADGTLYAATRDRVVRIAGTASSTPGAMTVLASEIPGGPDGVAPVANPSGGPATSVVVNRNDGTITRIDFSGAVPRLTDIVTGGTRGDFLVVGSDSCLYATQADSIERVSGVDGSCPFELSSPTIGLRPRAGHTEVVAPVSGRVMVKVPGSFGLVPLRAGQQVPNGSEVDVKKGQINLTVASGTTAPPSTATFYAGRFLVRQSRGSRPTTNLRLSEPLGCSARGRRAASSRRRSRRRTRRLWGRGRGHYSTRGRYSAATVRGTWWLVADTCTGTRTQVRQGSVRVRDFSRRRTVTVRAGHSYTARRRRR
ncbi:MAG: hypothetical protein E6G56_02190 [Actinobacteria bacterium]|nr:MAG: hypothetical protein E6G56_02190 [Actinomycetota bacterium]